jgi:hypothetical protein
MSDRQIIHRPGGEQWRRYELADGFVITTDSWRALVSDYPEAPGEVNAYRRQLVAAQSGQLSVQDSVDDPARTYIAEGGDGTVFAVGELMVAKEAKSWSGKSFLEYFERMENLRAVIQEHLPHWVGTPANYGIYVSEDRVHQNLLMQRIGSGITLDDIRKPEKAALFKRARLYRMLGSMTTGEHEELGERYTDTHMALVDAFRREGLRYEDHIKDWGPHNIIVEKLRAAIADSRFKLWIIDQQ